MPLYSGKLLKNCENLMTSSGTPFTVNKEFLEKLSISKRGMLKVRLQRGT